uniref:Purple acid phosphatase n=1 Tax=Parastrongyloides trichosuri TaxID=131310 RepID=A0A0N4ZQH4_PARTI
MKPFKYLLLFFSSILLFLFVTADTTPKHVHLSLNNDPQSMVFSWITFSSISHTSTPIVKYGTSNVSLTNTVTGSFTVFIYNGIVRYMYKATASNLQFNTRYYYQVGSEEGLSQIFSFKTFPQGNDIQLRICIFGDLGIENDISMLPLRTAGLRGDFDMIVHVGDLAYDLHSNDGKLGDEYMELMEPLISSMPYMVIAGNHEYDWKVKNFANYEKRFVMPDNGDGKNQYYSFSTGPIQFIGVSTEFYGFFYDFGIQPVLDQYSWLEKELIKANNNRNNKPWVMTYQHRPFYCSNENSLECDSFENRVIREGYLNMPGLEPLYGKYGVDINWSGHEHSYERMFPVYDRKLYNDSDYYHNAKATTYIITGSAGCHSFQAKFGPPSPFSAKRLNKYGYTVMHIKNMTHLYFEQIDTQAAESSNPVVDTWWMSKDIGYVIKDEIRENSKHIDLRIEYTEVPGFIRRLCVGRNRRCNEIFSKDLYKFSKSVQVPVQEYSKYWYEVVDSSIDRHNDVL